jgi:hypothetical protein
LQMKSLKLRRMQQQGRRRQVSFSDSLAVCMVWSLKPLDVLKHVMKPLVKGKLANQTHIKVYIWWDYSAQMRCLGYYELELGNLLCMCSVA